MTRTSHRRKRARRKPTSPRPRRKALPALGIVAPISACLLEQTENLLLLALGAVILQYTACPSPPTWPTRLSATLDGNGGCGSRRGRLSHVAVATLRRSLWRSFLIVLGGLSINGPRPTGPCVVVANHRSHADTVALLAALPARGSPRVAAAADYWFTGGRRRLFCRWLAAGVPVRRTGGGYADLTRTTALLSAGRIVVVFPEGTRSEQPGLAPFHGGAFALARAAGVPIVPVALTGTADVLGKNTRRLHRARMRVDFGRPLWWAEPDDARACIDRLLQAADPDQ